ncbi:MAG: M24 family metallopeptidase [Dehalococcoidia bacterium]
MAKMASKLTFGVANADWQERINVVRLREERAERARQIMRRHGIPAILATQNASLRYLTGLRMPPGMSVTSYVLFLVDRDPIVFAFAGYYQQMPDHAPWIKHWRVARSWLWGICGPEAAREEATLLARDVRAELQERGLAGERLAVVGFDELAKEALRGEGLTLVEGWPLMLEMRAIKTGDEINCFKMVASIGGVGYQKIWEALRPGITDIDVSRIAINAVYEAGADHASVGTRSGPLAAERGIDFTGRKLEHGDLVHVRLCGSQFLGYNACLYRTFIVGRKPTAKERGWCDQVRERLDAIIDAIRPGATTADAAKHFPPASTWGFKEEAEVLTVEVGHGIGLHEIYDMPVINRQWSFNHPQVFEPGMAIAVESLEGEHGVGGVRLEDMVVVTEDGAEIIDHFPGDEILVASA